ncbi:cysQ [Mytilus coruscus]|uniref:3'(2'),5'-bisphosphate nucleotidase 1 n=1 Tax=Mytilus coruscus TaxID=42192 RepID=A0A6J8CJK0_MYTCO|nr:cysQ [Mytilus coruscus]
MNKKLKGEKKSHKGKNDLQTEADRSAQRCIIASLHKQFPKVSIFGEETLDPSEKIPEEMFELGFSEEVLAHDCPEYLKDIKDEEIVIWVDPLDGTAEYTQGLLDHVTCLIGIAARGHSVAGIINQPFYNYKAGPDAELGRCIWGVIGLGSFGFTRDVLPKDEFIVTTSRSHSDRLVTETVEACEPTSVVRVGGAGHKVLLLIEGKVHAYVFASKGCKKWDTCAPESVLAAVGGRLTDMHGIKMSYGAGVQRKNTGGILATVSDHEYVVNKVPEHVKEVFDKSVEAQDWPEFELARIQHMNEKDVDQGIKRKKTDTPDSDSSRSTKSDLLADETLDTKL